MGLTPFYTGSPTNLFGKLPIVCTKLTRNKGFNQSVLKCLRLGLCGYKSLHGFNMSHIHHLMITALCRPEARGREHTVLDIKTVSSSCSITFHSETQNCSTYHSSLDDSDCRSSYVLAVIARRWKCADPVLLSTQSPFVTWFVHSVLFSATVIQFLPSDSKCSANCLSYVQGVRE